MRLPVVRVHQRYQPVRLHGLLPELVHLRPVRQLEESGRVLPVDGFQPLGEDLGRRFLVLDAKHIPAGQGLNPQLCPDAHLGRRGLHHFAHHDATVFQEYLIGRQGGGGRDPREEHPDDGSSVHLDSSIPSIDARGKPCSVPVSHQERFDARNDLMPGTI